MVAPTKLFVIASRISAVIASQFSNWRTPGWPLLPFEQFTSWQSPTAAQPGKEICVILRKLARRRIRSPSLPLEGKVFPLPTVHFSCTMKEKKGGHFYEKMV
jgi:hypothetical protein